MAPVLGFIFLVVPLVELAVIIEVGQRIGVLNTVAVLIGISIAGAVLAKREGVAVWTRFRAAIQRGEVPSNEIVDGFCVLLGAALLLTPGFLTDLLGLALLFPLSRALIRRWLRAGAGMAFLRRFPFARAFANRSTVVRPDGQRAGSYRVVEGTVIRDASEPTQREGEGGSTTQQG